MGANMKRILFVHPNNFLKGGQGENIRVLELLKLFISMGYEVDLFSFENFSPDSTFADYDKYDKDNKIKNLYIYDFAASESGMKNGERSFGNRVKNKIKKEIKNFKKDKYLQNWVRPGMKKLFDEVVKNCEYSVIALFYTYLSDLLVNTNISGKKVYFMEDSMFLQQYAWEKYKNPKMTLGKLMDEEIERINMFDEFFCISHDEKIFYEKICGKSMYFLPHLLPEGNTQITIPVNERKWDVFFIGYNNPYNVDGLEWFLDKVYPHLDKKMNILLAGSATDCITKSYNNITVTRFIPDLEEVYKDVKVAICPMFSGTGMKIKVVESMSKGIPVVCNERGVDGFPDKTVTGCLVTQDAKEFAYYINDLKSNPSFYLETVKTLNAYYEKTFDREKYKALLDDVLS